jgi:hypothetical protein
MLVCDVIVLTTYGWPSSLAICSCFVWPFLGCQFDTGTFPLLLVLCVDSLCALVHWYRLVPVRRGLKLVAGICLGSCLVCVDYMILLCLPWFLWCLISYLVWLVLWCMVVLALGDLLLGVLLLAMTVLALVSVVPWYNGTNWYHWCMARAIRLVVIVVAWPLCLCLCSASSWLNYPYCPWYTLVACDVYRPCFVLLPLSAHLTCTILYIASCPISISVLTDLEVANMNIRA